jgi:hypothetical protein
MVPSPAARIKTARHIRWFFMRVSYCSFMVGSKAGRLGKMAGKLFRLAWAYLRSY